MLLGTVGAVPDELGKIDPGSRGWAKLDAGIVDSSIWVQAHDVLRVWIALLAKADAYGRVRVARPALAHLCFVDPARLDEIMAYLEAPDEHSRNRDHDGRRLKSVAGGWVILGYEAWRNSLQRKPASHAERQKRYRERQQSDE